MHKLLRVIVVLAVIAVLFVLGTVYRPGFLAGTGIDSYLSDARTLAYQAYAKVLPLLSVDYWRNWAKKQDALAAKPAPRPVIVIHHLHQHNSQVAALIPPPATRLPGPANSTPSPPEANASDDISRHVMSKAFEGCWKGTVTQPGTWEYVQGPPPTGWSPATYTLCIHHAGPSADANVSVDTTIQLTSQWVVPWTGERNGHTDVVFQSPDLVILRSTGELPLELKVMGFLPGPKPSVTYTDYFRCSVQNGKLDVIATMVDRCDGSVVENCRGQPWIRQSWHQQLARSEE
jgi:hypothetical protein